MFKYNGDDARIKTACIDANNPVLFTKVIERIKNIDTFYMSDASPEKIANIFTKFAESNEYMEILTYKPAWRWSKAIGYFDASKPNKIFLNAYKLNRGRASYVGNFYHELTHYLSFRSGIYFNHGSNSPRGKENTAPYFIGNLAMRLYEERDWLDNFEDEIEIETYKARPWWHRVLFFWR